MELILSKDLQPSPREQGPSQAPCHKAWGTTPEIIILCVAKSITMESPGVSIKALVSRWVHVEKS